MQKSRILIYQDYVHNNGQLHRALTSFGDVEFCDAEDICNGILNINIGLFVMPGGADLYYCEKLNGSGNAAIRRYVESGGSYLGICAGAYYACAALEWAKGTALEISGPRELNFYNGTASGPVYDYLENNDIDRSWFCAVPLRYDDGQRKLETLVAYAAGPVFTGGTARVLARYESGDAAIIECDIGQGRAILSSPHIEYVMPHAEQSLYRHNNMSYDHQSRAFQALAPYGQQQKLVLTTIIDRLTCKKTEVHAA